MLRQWPGRGSVHQYAMHYKPSSAHLFLSFESELICGLCQGSLDVLNQSIVTLIFCIHLLRIHLY